MPGTQAATTLLSTSIISPDFLHTLRNDVWTLIANFSPIATIVTFSEHKTYLLTTKHKSGSSRLKALYIAVSLKTQFKRHMPGEFHDCSWVFWSRHCSRKGARRVEERKKTKMTKLDFHRFQVRHFSNNLEQSPCYCKMGQRQIADLSVFGRIKFITRRNISVWTLIHCM